jgi:hypothetical protein
MLGLGLSLQKGISAFNAGRALVSSYIRRVTDAGGVLQNTACDAAAINELNQDRLLEPASWVLVPDGIEEDIVFAQKPTSGLGDLTFTRASDATYTDSTGVVRRSPYNLLQQSEDFSNAAWSKSASSISSNVTTAPNGTLTADKLIEDTANTSHTIFQTISISASTNYNYSVYLKAAERFRFRIRFTGFSGAQDATVNLNTQTTSLGTLTSVGNGWFRFAWSVNSGAGGSSTLVAITLQDDSGNSTYLGNGTSGAFIWGAQFVEGTEALDYFPTTNRQDVPRIDFRNADGSLSSCGRLLLEPQRTNSIRNSTMVGAVVGTPGTIPTNWTGGGFANLTQTLVGLGTENGLQYIDLRFNGTAVGTIVRIFSESTTQITASNGQTWSSSVYIKRISGTFDSCAIGHALRGIGGSGLGVQTATVSVTTSLARYATTQTVNNASTLSVQPLVDFNVTSGAAYDFTIRIAAPQMELGAYATTFIPTTTAAVTRIKDDAQKTGVSSIIGQSAGTIFWDVNDVTGAPANTGNPDFGIRNTAFTNWIGITTNGFNLPFRVDVRATSGILISYTANITRAKAAVAWSSAGAVLYVNGVQVGTSAVNPNFSFDVIQMLGGIISYKTNQAALFPTRLTNDQLEVLTSEGYGTYALLAQSLNCVLQ